LSFTPHNKTNRYLFCRCRQSTKTKQLKGLENLEETLIEHKKKKLADVLERVTDLQNELFRNKSTNDKLVPQFYWRNGESFNTNESVKTTRQKFTITIL
jgi:hypothetical protein